MRVELNSAQCFTHVGWLFWDAKFWVNKIKLFLIEICSVIEKRGKDFKPCTFPFIYEEVKYYNCTVVNDPDGKPWCSTKVDDDGNHVQSGGYWGHCGQDCKDKVFQEKPEFSIPPFSPGMLSYFFSFDKSFLYWTICLYQQNTTTCWSNIILLSNTFLNACLFTFMAFSILPNKGFNHYIAISNNLPLSWNLSYTVLLFLANKFWNIQRNSNRSVKVKLVGV